MEAIKSPKLRFLPSIWLEVIFVLGAGFIRDGMVCLFCVVNGSDGRQRREARMS